jgi:hypothetical protein
VPRRLKTYITAGGFFDLAVAAPSMKVALETWGAETNLFHQGFAKASDDEDIVAATMAKPGVVLRRPVGTDTPFSEHAELPTQLGLQGPAKAPSTPKAKPAKPTRHAEEKSTRETALEFERERKRREREARREELAQEKARARRDRTIATAQAELDDAKHAHQDEVEALLKARLVLDQKLEAIESKWRRQEEELERALRKAKSLG